MKKKRKDTKLASNGAEFYVLSCLLLNEIETYKTYTNFEGYDLISVYKPNNKQALIQVKSKNYKGDFSFYLNKKDKVKPDFYIFINIRAYKYIKKIPTLITDYKYKPRFFVIDYETVQTNKRVDKDGTLWLALTTDIKNYENLYEGNCKLIKDFLEK